MAKFPTGFFAEEDAFSVMEVLRAEIGLCSDEYMYMYLAILAIYIQEYKFNVMLQIITFTCT